MTEYTPSSRQSLLRKLRNAWRGVRRGVRSEGNFLIHLFVTAAVIAAGVVFRITLLEWCLLGLCVALVLAVEMMNTAIEHLARVVSKEQDPFIADALDMAAGAVLLAAGGAALVGILVIGSHLWS